MEITPFSMPVRLLALVENAGHMFVDMDRERSGYMHKASIIQGFKCSDSSLYDGKAQHF